MGFGFIDAMKFMSRSPEEQAREIGARAICGTFTISCWLMVGVVILGTKYSISAHCTGRVLFWPMLSVYIFLLVIFMCGFVGVMLRVECFKVLYVLGVLLMIAALLGVIIFGYVAVGGSDFSRVEVREYNLTHYRGWLKHRIAEPQRWATISACIHHRQACKRMRNLVRDPKTGVYIPLLRGDEISPEEGDDDNTYDYDTFSPRPIELGCCTPPSSCPFSYVNGTTTTTSAPAPASAPSDYCSRWSNDQDKLCFQCDSCKAALLDENRKSWTAAAAFPIITTLILLIGICCLLPHASFDRRERR